METCWLVKAWFTEPDFFFSIVRGATCKLDRKDCSRSKTIAVASLGVKTHGELWWVFLYEDGWSAARPDLIPNPKKEKAFVPMRELSNAP